MKEKEDRKQAGRGGGAKFRYAAVKREVRLSSWTRDLRWFAGYPAHRRPWPKRLCGDHDGDNDAAAAAVCARGRCCGCVRLSVTERKDNVYLYTKCAHMYTHLTTACY